MNFDPKVIDAQTCYRLLVGSIIPRPIAWISSLSAGGVLNLAPYSFFTVASCNPPVLAVTQVTPRDRAAKDTLNNLRTTGECVVNIVSETLAGVMNATCADYPASTSEFDAVGIAREASHLVAPDGVRDASVRFECWLREIIDVSSLPTGGQLMLLDVVSIYASDSVMINGNVSPQLLDAVGKLGGDLYTSTRERFEMARPVLK